MPELPPLRVPPMQSRCLSWHQETWNSLSTLFEKERLPHAMLLEGQPGTGRNRLALSLARYLLCSDMSSDGNCGNCKTCSLSASGAHPDLMTVIPAESGKAIGIDAIREVIRFASGTPTLGRYKLIVISPTESLTPAAFNAFLKCLEEPASDTFIIMVSASGYPLPATIRSRCQRWQLPTPMLSLSRDWVLETLGEGAVSEQLVDAMLDLCVGRPLDALQKLGSDECEALITLHACVKTMLRSEQKSPALENALAGVSPDTGLDVLETALQSWLRTLSADQLRSQAALRGFVALDTLAQLRAAKRSGSNPNADLLRFTATSAVNGLWEG